MVNVLLKDELLREAGFRFTPLLPGTWPLIPASPSAPGAERVRRMRVHRRDQLPL
jgi:hypothetical protein